MKSDTGVMIGEKLPKWAIERYSRQILLPDIGVKGQEKLMDAKVLIVGAGGLGCPSSVYLAGAGVGEIGIVDYDTVDVTNIHRQILHGESDQNISKVESAANSLRSINSTIKVVPYNMELTPSNALELAAKYDIILDCTDNVPTRYMLNDVSVLNKMPLISGSALKMEGQLTVYGYRAERNPNEKDSTYRGSCYRCVFPTPPPAAAVGSCSTTGVAGPVPGAIGTLQALEAIKLIVGKTHDSLLVGRMLLFDGEDMSFRNVKLRGRNPECDICSENPKITKLLDYEVVCRMQSKEKDLNLHILPPKNRISATQLADTLRQTNKHLLVDVRSESEFDMCKLDGAVNYPLEKLHRNNLDELLRQTQNFISVTFICRRGNDSQIAAKKVLDLLEDEHKEKITDLTGGLHAWSKYVDGEFPVY
ncbi:adenylyltransferase and sulfurtransferase MOCS3 [Melitaea cinxia]|uniref:adenylyltransferase and sulfurtransferase MOCS3 n=1 Tax=Melitaea cinxia TaxID=113334 RepID=UPI001E26ECBA|nr:adenylyltransferase and sulfurtransferase MOCS3 [Melitaea cinxia]